MSYRIAYLLSIAVIAAGFAVLALGLSSQARQGQQAHDSLCVVKAKLAHDIRKARSFLDEHPTGIPGIPAKLIKDGIADDEATLTALNILTC